MPDLLNNKQKQKRPVTQGCAKTCVWVPLHHQGYGFRFSNHGSMRPNKGSSILQARTRLELLEQHGGHDCTSKSLHKVNVCRQKKNTILQGQQLEMVEGFFFCCVLQVTTDTWEIFHLHSHHFTLVHFYTLVSYRCLMIWSQEFFFSYKERVLGTSLFFEVGFLQAKPCDKNYHWSEVSGAQIN